MMIVTKLLRQMSKSTIQLWMICLEITRKSDILNQVSIQYQIKYHSNVLIPQLEIFDTSYCPNELWKNENTFYHKFSFVNITKQVIEVQLQAHVKMAQKQRSPQKEEEAAYISQRRQKNNEKRFSFLS